MSLWLDKVTRTGLKFRLEAETELGQETTTLWHDGKSFELDLRSAIKILYALEIYASKCYDNTQYHLSMVNSL